MSTLIAGAENYEFYKYNKSDHKHQRLEELERVFLKIQMNEMKCYFREAMAVYYEKLEPIFNTQTIWKDNSEGRCIDEVLYL